MAITEYDVAISFLHRDEAIANQLESRLGPSLSVFVYSKQQEELAGTDGLESFREVFLNKSKLVVVLYRDGWGETRWTRVEETAIKDRCFNSGWKSLLVVSMDSVSTHPKWLPETNIRLNIEEYGIEQCLGAIKARAQELGAHIHKETIAQLTERVKREVAIEDERKRYLSSDKAAGDALSEAENLFQECVKLANSISDPKTSINFVAKIEYDSLNVKCSGFTLEIAWNYEASNTLHKAGLYVRMWERNRGPIYRPQITHNENLLKQCKYLFDVDSSNQPYWRETFENKELLTSKQLIEDWMKALLERIQQYKRSLS